MLTPIGQEINPSVQTSFWKKKYNLLFVFVALVTFGFWVAVRFTHTTDTNVNYIFSLLLGIVPIVASVKGLIAAKRWGGTTSVLGRSIGALSFGGLFWGIGELIWSYYNLVLNKPVPYPSYADIAFVIGYISWIFGALFLSRLAAVKIILRKKPKLWWLVGTVTLASVALSYYLLIVVARQGVALSDSSDTLKVVLDIFYPLGDFLPVAIVAIIMAVSGRYIGGRLRLPIVLSMLGLAILYIGDVVYVYTTTTGSFYNANWGDLILFVAMTTYSVSLIAYSDSTPHLKQPRGEE